MNGPKIPFTARFFVLPALSGALFALALPWVGFSWSVWFGLVPLLLFVSGESASYKQAFQGGLITGVVYLSAVAYPLLSLNAWWWLQAQGVVYENKSILLFWILYIAVLIGSALFGVFALLFKKLRRECFFSVIILALAWIFLEYLRAQILFGFTWGHLGYAMYDSLPMLQLGAYGGAYGVSFVIVLFNILLYYAIYRAYETVGSVEGTSTSVLFFRFLLKRWYLYVAIFLLGAAFTAGSFLLKTNIPAEQEIPVAVIQPGPHKTPEGDETETIRLLEGALRDGAALVVIPESALPLTIFDEETRNEEVPPYAIAGPEAGGSAYQKLIALSEKYSNVAIAVGLDSKKGAMFYNSLVVFENGMPGSVYHKRVLFPFSERSVGWFPWKTIEPLGKGLPRQTVNVRGEPVDALICSEILFPELLEESASRYVIAVGNDGVFDNPAVAEYNDAIARFTAVAARKYVIRAMKTGVSGIIDPWGREVARSVSSNNKILIGVISY